MVAELEADVDGEDAVRIGDRHLDRDRPRSTSLSSRAVPEVPIPRRIWFLWLQGLDDAPEVVRRCHRSWVERNPGWEVQVLTSQGVNDWAPGALEAGWSQRLPPAQQADLVRLLLLVGYGGLWVDATCFCAQSLDSWLHQVAAEGLFAFARPAADRILASWFLAAVPAHPLVRALQDQLCEYWQQSDPHYRSGTVSARALEDLVRWHLVPHRVWFHPAVWRTLGARPYFAFHYMAERVLAADPALAKLWEAVPKVSADGPHRPQSVGLDRDLTPPVRHVLATEASPVYKLTWKRSATVMPGSVLAWVLDR